VREGFSIFQILFYFVFKTKFNYEPNQIQKGFQIYFSTQIKMDNFSMFSKKNLQLFKFFYFQIFLSFISKPFSNPFQRHSKLLWSLDQHHSSQ